MAWASVNRETGKAVVYEGRDLEVLWGVDRSISEPISGDTVHRDEFLGPGETVRIDDAGPYPFRKLREQLGWQEAA